MLWMRLNHRSRGQIVVSREFYKDQTKQYRKMYVGHQPHRTVVDNFKVKPNLPDWVVKDDAVFLDRGSFFAFPIIPVVE
jgi:hypothetical protein